jgi:hypothetical protein
MSCYRTLIGENDHLGKITKRDKESLKQLVLDCSIYKLDEKEALDYINSRIGKHISGRTYRRYKKNIDNGNVAEQWINDFTRIGFVLLHKEQMDIMEKIQNDSLKQLSIETQEKVRDEDKILKLKRSIRESARLLIELNLDTPIITRIKASVDSTNQKYNQLLKTVSMKHPELLKESF